MTSHSYVAAWLGRDQSLVTERGKLQNGGKGEVQVSFTPTKTKRGLKTVLARLTGSRQKVYCTTKRLNEQYRVSYGHNRCILCPLVPEGIIKSQCSARWHEIKFFFHELLDRFS